MVMRQTQEPRPAYKRFPEASLHSVYGLVQLTTPECEPSVGDSVSLFREPDAGNLPVRFDERGQETGPSQTGLRWRGESQVEISTGRLQLLRLFSTLLYGPPPECKKNWVGREAVCENVSGL